MTNTNTTLTAAQILTIANATSGTGPAWHVPFAALVNDAAVTKNTIKNVIRKGGTLKGEKAAAILRFARTACPEAVPANTSAPALGTVAAVEEIVEERKDEEILADINERFEVMGDLVDMAIKNTVASIIVTGPGGIGKTYPIERKLEEAMARDGVPFVSVSGSISAVELYAAADSVKDGGVLLIDDADSALETPESMNIIKALTDTKRTRVVSWMKQNRSLEERGIEPQFEFKGSVIIISNANVREIAAGTTKKAGHMDAVLSRALHIDLGINDARSLAIRVRYMIEDCDMLAQTLAGFGIIGEDYEELKGEIAEFIKDNAEAFRSLTLREADKLARTAGGALAIGKDWKRMARLTLGVL